MKIIATNHRSKDRAGLVGCEILNQAVGWVGVDGAGCGAWVVRKYNAFGGELVHHCMGSLPAAKSVLGCECAMADGY